MTAEKILPPGSTIGILGGGQLGRMTAMAASRLGYRSIIYSPDAHSIAGDVSAGHIRGDYDDAAALDFFKFLVGPEAREIFLSAGFSVIGAGTATN